METSPSMLTTLNSAKYARDKYYSSNLIHLYMAPQVITRVMGTLSPNGVRQVFDFTDSLMTGALWPRHISWQKHRLKEVKSLVSWQKPDPDYSQKFVGAQYFRPWHPKEDRSVETFPWSIPRIPWFLWEKSFWTQTVKLNTSVVLRPLQ